MRHKDQTLRLLGNLAYKPHFCYHRCEKPEAFNCERSSVVERCPDKTEVEGPIPSTRTNVLMESDRSRTPFWKESETRRCPKWGSGCGEGADGGQRGLLLPHAQ